MFKSIVTLATVLITSASAAVLAPQDSCNSGGVYCGQSLINKGDYRDDIVESLVNNGQPTDEAHIENSLFICLGGGDISYQTFCANGCTGVGSTADDACI